MLQEKALLLRLQCNVRTVLVNIAKFKCSDGTNFLDCNLRKAVKLRMLDALLYV